MLDNDPELVEYRERIERRYHQRREGLRRDGTGRRTEDAPHGFAAAFPLPVLLMFAALILGGVLFILSI